MAHAARTDANQASIAEALRRAGCTVFSLHAVGQGCPDLLAGYRGVNYLLEVKDGAKAQSARKLTPDQVEFHNTWRGQRAVVNNEEEALRAIGAIK